MRIKEIGMRIPQPKNKCEDRKCPFHGTLRIRGRLFNAEVTKTVVNRTATIKFPHFYYISKYERFEKRLTKLKTHNPSCINAKQGDFVKVVESKPISKTKNFVIVEVIKK